MVCKLWQFEIWDIFSEGFLMLSAMLYSTVQNTVFTEESTNVCKLHMHAHIHGIQLQHAVKIES